jgi:hypothetical protein
MFLLAMAKTQLTFNINLFGKPVLIREGCQNTYNYKHPTHTQSYEGVSSLR